MHESNIMYLCMYVCTVYVLVLYVCMYLLRTCIIFLLFHVSNVSYNTFKMCIIKVGFFFQQVLGGLLGHAFCTGLAVIGGRMLAARISEKTVAIIGGLSFLFFALTSFLFGPDADF